jgi:cytoplasmic iron level regulating protein YaaA (DUF328/UPF0246 family)
MKELSFSILIHSSKTMKPHLGSANLHTPRFVNEAREINSYLRELSADDIGSVMKLSSSLSSKTRDLIQDWSTKEGHLTAAIDCFSGDIYSGLQVADMNSDDRLYADEVLFILSGLYGVLSPLDGVFPYRLELAYRFPNERFNNLYSFWGERVVARLPSQGIIVNLSSVEYAKLILPFVDGERVITPMFYTISPKTGEPIFIVVHAKIARGAFAHWLIKTKTTSLEKIQEFKDLGYRYDPSLSKPLSPAFVCETFGGIGLSIRLQ